MVQLFDIDELYGYVKEFTQKHHMEEAKKALAFAVKSHKGQLRKEGIPFIVHPLTMAASAIAVGIEEENIIASMLLHDVCEDCGIDPEQLPFCLDVKKAVGRLTFRVLPGETRKEAKMRYFLEMRDSREAVIAKIADRNHNISSMAGAFCVEKMVSYMEETKEYLYPLIEYGKEICPEYGGALFIMEYQLKSVIGTIEETLKKM